MRDFYPEFEKVLELLGSGCTSLKELAHLSGRDIFSFYQSADLSGLNLQGQDLSGMNFEKANLRSSNLNDISYDLGAFNGSIIGEEYSRLKDEYDTYLSDILVPQMRRIYIFAALRPETIEKCFAAARIGYGAFARSSGIGEGTLRKARRGEVISPETLYKLADTMEHLLTSAADWDSVANFASVNQPMVKLLSLRPDGAFKYISRTQLGTLFDMSARIDKEHLGVSPEGGPINFSRSNPDTLAWLSEFYDRSDFFPIMADDKD